MSRVLVAEEEFLAHIKVKIKFYEDGRKETEIGEMPDITASTPSFTGGWVTQKNKQLKKKKTKAKKKDTVAEVQGEVEL